jgi:hypothetical protein
MRNRNQGGVGCSRKFQLEFRKQTTQLCLYSNPKLDAKVICHYLKRISLFGSFWHLFGGYPLPQLQFLLH